MSENSGYLALGLMSGTSMDGLDLALCRINNTHNKVSYKLVAAKTVPYPYYLKEKLEDALSISTLDLHELDQELGAFYAEQILKFNNKQNCTPDLIASHGHTVLHQPDKGITLQIGDGDVIAQQTGITVVSDFRIQDVAKGGQGAPLVPVGDRDLFGEYAFCLNLGGIANVSFDLDGKRIACDISPCNMALNTITSWIDMEYDNHGKLASKGKVNTSLLSRLNAIEHIADQVSGLINQFHKRGSSVLVTGGGAYNSHLIDRLKNKCHADLVIPGEQLINFKEAIVFAYLALLRVKNEVNVLASVTGANSDTSAGIINQPKSI